MDALLTTDDLVQILGVPRHTIYQWRSAGVGPRGYRVGKHVRYDRAEFAAWLKERREAA